MVEETNKNDWDSALFAVDAAQLRKQRTKSYDSARWQWARTPSAQRTLPWLLLPTLAVQVVLWSLFLFHRWDIAYSLPLCLAAMISASAFSYVLHQGTYGICAPHPFHLDEFQQRLRSQCYEKAYRMLLPIGMIIFAVAFAVEAWVENDDAVSVAAVLSFLPIVMTLPAAICSWRLGNKG
jgi:hypothetical protein